MDEFDDPYKLNNLEGTYKLDDPDDPSRVDNLSESNDLVKIYNLDGPGDTNELDDLDGPENPNGPDDLNGPDDTDSHVFTFCASCLESTFSLKLLNSSFYFGSTWLIGRFG